MKRDDTMGIYETITLRSHRFDKIIELLENACEKSDDFNEIQEYFSLIRCIEEERSANRSKANKDFANEMEMNL